VWQETIEKIVQNNVFSPRHTCKAQELV
jgi:hypothetical protein